MTTTATTVATTVATTATVAAAVRKVQPARHLSVVLATDADKSMNKGGRAGVPVNPYYGKLNKRTVIVGKASGSTTYANANTNVDADWVVRDHPFADHVESSALMRHRDNGTLYVGIIVDKARHSNHKIVTQYTDKITGAVVDHATLAPWLKSKNHRPQVNGKQFMMPAIGSIVEACIDKTVYTVAKPAPLTFADVKSLITTPTTANP